MAVRLKERCKGCDGCGFYDRGMGRVPCWTCRGRGWTGGVMPSPEPKWAREFDRGVAATRLGDEHPVPNADQAARADDEHASSVLLHGDPRG